MTSEPTRDPLTDALLTPKNCALVVIDYQRARFRRSLLWTMTY